jgi:hypothetical protein
MRTRSEEPTEQGTAPGRLLNIGLTQLVRRGLKLSVLIVGLFLAARARSVPAPAPDDR